MSLPDPRSLGLNENVLPEATQHQDRIVLWLSGPCANGFREWTRVSSVARAAITTNQRICSTEAFSIRARQRLQGLVGKLLGRLWQSTPTRTWLLPNGASAEQYGEKQTNQLLVWPENEQTPLDEISIKSQWPKSEQVNQLGKNLFLVDGVSPKSASTKTLWHDDSRELVEKNLAGARASGDKRRLAAALADFGAYCLREQDWAHAATVLEEALPLTRQLGDRAWECDVLNNLGSAMQETGQPTRAVEFFEQAVAQAIPIEDKFAAKTALERLGVSCLRMHNLPRSLSYLEKAFNLAGLVNDQRHRGQLLWYRAIVHAEQGRREDALTQGRAAIELLEKCGGPEAACYADHLKQYEQDQTELRLQSVDPTLVMSMDTNLAAHSEVVRRVGEPALLRKAVGAAKSLSRAIGPDTKTVSLEIRTQRLDTCATCEHNTGVRCRLSGSFTHVSSWLAHETCPVGKWRS